jgi:acyl-[acyl-carrier-protein]-phospholipid O-acyltransferase/long-chain-fatty-acid--[acyl-carrier-protein] ligase
MFGTDTFLNGYARAAKDGDFDSLRMIVAGAEAVKPETRKMYRDRFGALIVEGYGMTEASPVVAVNSATFNREGAVGRLLAGMEMRIDPVEGIEEGGRLQISGPNLMLGYMRDDKPGVLQLRDGHWHDTGDIVAVDKDGFIAIKGRAKRFAKIAGEMISLGAVEMMVKQLWPEADHAAVAIPDKRRGERIVLVTTQAPARKDELIAYSKRYGATEMMIPDDIVNVDAIPVLGSGKVDYTATMKLVAG